MGSKSDGADEENPQVLHYSQLALDLRSAIAAVAMSLTTAAEIQDQDVPRRDITVTKMDGSEFRVEVECADWSLVKVSDLKRIIAVHENISFDMFDISSVDVVLKSPEQLKLSLINAGILDGVSITMKKGDDCPPASDECTVCRMSHGGWQEFVCRRCYWQQMATSQTVVPRRADPQL